MRYMNPKTKIDEDNVNISESRDIIGHTERRAWSVDTRLSAWLLSVGYWCKGQYLHLKLVDVCVTNLPINVDSIKTQIFD